MELSKGKIGEVVYVPEYQGNRDLPQDERLSVVIKPLRRVDFLAQMGWEEATEEVLRWRDKELKRFIQNPEYGELIKQLPLSILKGMRQFVGHISGFRNFIFDGEEKTDPAEIYLLLAGEAAEGVEDLGEDDIPQTLVGELQQAVVKTYRLKGEDLKNWLGQCAGLSNPSTTAQPAPTE